MIRESPAACISLAMRKVSTVMYSSTTSRVRSVGWMRPCSTAEQKLSIVCPASAPMRSAVPWAASPAHASA
jgi:hypothetical protein